MVTFHFDFSSSLFRSNGSLQQISMFCGTSRTYHHLSELVVAAVVCAALLVLRQAFISPCCRETTSNCMLGPRKKSSAQVVS